MNSINSTGYESNFSNNGFWDTAKRYAKKAGREVIHKAICLWLVIHDSDAPAWAKGIAMAALGYFISPLDLIPDPTPVIGLSDDIAVIAAAFATLAAYISDEIKAKATKMLPAWLVSD